MSELRSLENGKAFGRYVIEALLGVGGMGAVYRARDTQLGRLVALKVVRAGRTDVSGVDPEVRLLGEARSVAALRHPNIVAVYDAGVIDGQTFVAMEFVEGKPLRAYVGDPRIEYDERRRWLLEVAEALAAAHRAGIVHRDVKPENVLIGTDRRARVLDFGIAKRIRFDTEAPTSDGATPETIEGRVVGTVSYMAPEQLAGGEVSAAWDQFAWAVMAFELLTGRHPRAVVAMPGPTAHLDSVRPSGRWPPSADLDSVRPSGRRPPSADLRQRAPLANELAPEVTFNEGAAIALAMAHAPARRFASMGELVAAFRDRASVPEVLRPRKARTDAPAPRGRGARGRMLYVVGALVVLVVGVTIGLGLHRGAPALVAASPLPSASPSPHESAVASVVSATAVASTAPSAAPSVLAARATPSATVPHVSGAVGPIDSTTCECYSEWGALCAPQEDYRLRSCACVDDETSEWLKVGAFPVDRAAYGTNVVEGTPCRGLNSFQIDRAGKIGGCVGGCKTKGYAGLHRAACRGRRAITGEELTGILFCY